MEYLIIKHLEIDKKKRNEFKDTEEMNITLHKKKCKWPVNPWKIYLASLVNVKKLHILNKWKLIFLPKNQQR